MKVTEMIGKKFGRLTVAGRGGKLYGNEDKKYAVWVCLCDCGTEKTIPGCNLRRGLTKSCGCLRRELSSERRRKSAVPIDTAVALAFLRGYKGSATHRGLAFELSDSEAVALGLSDCHYCGRPPSRSVRVHGRKKSAQNGNLLLNGIDRVDNSQGYTVANTVACCSICNDGKKDMPITQWLAYLDKLVAFRSGNAPVSSAA